MHFSSEIYIPREKRNQSCTNSHFITIEKKTHNQWTLVNVRVILFFHTIHILFILYWKIHVFTLNMFCLHNNTCSSQTPPIRLCNVTLPCILLWLIVHFNLCCVIALKRFMNVSFWYDEIVISADYAKEGNEYRTVDKRKLKIEFNSFYSIT